VQHTTQRQQELEQQMSALSARLSQASKDLLTAKTQSDLQIEAINARNAAIASLNGQKSALEQNCGALSRATEELRARLAEVMNEAHQLRTAAQQTDTELQRALAQLSAQAAAAKVVVPSTSSISSDTLLSSLQCPLCEQLLIDAVVLPCSHGFCRACVESRWAQCRQSSSNGVRGGSGGGSAAQKAACRCPRCDAVAATTSRGNGKNPALCRFLQMLMLIMHCPWDVSTSSWRKQQQQQGRKKHWQGQRWVRVRVRPQRPPGQPGLVGAGDLRPRRAQGR
jgi:hypothetical protein